MQSDWFAVISDQNAKYSDQSIAYTFMEQDEHQQFIPENAKKMVHTFQIYDNEVQYAYCIKIYSSSADAFKILSCSTNNENNEVRLNFPSVLFQNPYVLFILLF